MKVRVYTRFPWSIAYGGAEIQAQKYIEYIKKMGVDIDLINHYDLSSNYDILHIIGMDYNSCRLIKVAKDKKIKTILSPVYYTTPMKSMLISMYLNIFPNISLTIQNLMKSALEEADIISPNSIAEEKQIKRTFGINDRSALFKVIYNGIDYENIEQIKPQQFVDQYNIHDEYILSVAMLDKRKNVINLIKGFLESGTNKKLVLIGDIRETNRDYMQELQGLINKNNKKVVHLPFINDRLMLNAAYAGAKIHAMASLFETPGLSNIEAARFGCNLVVGDCEPVREYFSDVPFYANSKSIRSIANAISAAEREDRSLMGEKVAIGYSWDNIAKELFNLYKSLS